MTIGPGKDTRKRRVCLPAPSRNGSNESWAQNVRKNKDNNAGGFEPLVVPLDEVELRPAICRGEHGGGAGATQKVRRPVVSDGDRDRCVPKSMGLGSWSDKMKTEWIDKLQSTKELTSQSGPFLPNSYEGKGWAPE